jgi:hypothetical protein
LAAKASTATIPIVFAFGADPVQAGFVASLNRPGGNITGASFFATEISGKALGLLYEVIPNAAVIALMVNPKNPESAGWLSSAQGGHARSTDNCLCLRPALQARSTPPLPFCGNGAPARFLPAFETHSPALLRPSRHPACAVFP